MQEVGINPAFARGVIEYDELTERLARTEREYLRLKRECEVSRETEDRSIAMLARWFLPDRGQLPPTTKPNAPPDV